MAVWLVNIYGVKISLAVGYVTGALLMIPLAVFIVVPYFTGDWHSSNVTYLKVPGYSNFSVWMVWLFIMCWSAYGVEVCASFAPEYHDTKRDTSLALRTSAIFCLAVFTLLPLGLGGVTGAHGDSGAFYVTAFRDIVGSQLGGVALVLLIASLILAMNTATADAGRALFGISREGMTIKELGHLNKHHVPGRGMTVNMVLNCCLILFVANNLAILYLSNIGYVLCHVLALSGFLLLRRDRPGWPRPIKLSPVWIVVAAVLMVVDLTFLVYGLTQQSLVALLGGYQHSGGPFILGIGILVLSVLLFFYRRAIQDKQPITLRDKDVSAMPTEAQMALLQAELEQ